MIVPTTAEIAEGVRTKMAAQPDRLAEAKPLADALVEQLRERIPNADPAVIAAVLLLAGSYVGYRVWDQMSELWIEMDRFHMRTANAIVVAGEQLFTEVTGVAIAVGPDEKRSFTMADYREQM